MVEEGEKRVQEPMSLIIEEIWKLRCEQKIMSCSSTNKKLFIEHFMKGDFTKRPLLLSVNVRILKRRLRQYELGGNQVHSENTVWEIVFNLLKLGFDMFLYLTGF